MASSNGIRAGAAYVELFLNDGKLVRGLPNAQAKLKAFSESVSAVGRSMMTAAAVAVAVPGITDAVTMTIDQTCKPQGYRLSITPKGIRIAGDSLAGVRYGAATLTQIARQSGEKLPCLEIEDWPELRVRGVYYDVCRGRVAHLDRLFELADNMAAYKLNELQLYIEHTFAFRRHPLIGQNAGSLTGEDIMRLDRHCTDRGIELVPSLASFGHMSTVLRHKCYHHLAEDYGCLKYHPDLIKAKPGVLHCGIAQSLAPANPKVYDFLKELYGEFLPCFSSRKFNVCCDETWDLGGGQSHALAQKIGCGQLYLGHIKKLNEIARDYGKRIQFWGDIIRHYPELIKSIPKDVTVLDWGYGAAENFDRIKDFTATKLESYVCPSVCSYVTLYPRVPESMDNIAGWAKAAVKHGAQGLLNTDWGDGGHYNFLEYSWIGYLFGAEQGWNTKADRASFMDRFCRLYLNIDSASFRHALDEMGDISHLHADSHYQSVWLHVFFAKPFDMIFSQKETGCSVSEKGVISHRIIRWNAAFGASVIKRLQRIRSVFTAAAKGKGADPKGLLPYYIFAVDATIFAARKLTVFGHGGKNTPAARNAIKTEMKSLMKRFEALWMARSRRSEIDITLNRYRAAIAAIDEKPVIDPWVQMMSSMKISKIVARPKGGVAAAPCVALSAKLGWNKLEASCGGSSYGFINAHGYYGDKDGLVYLGAKVRVEKAGTWQIALGHDGGAKVFVDGAEVCCEPERINPATPGRTTFMLSLDKGTHEVMVAFDLDHGLGWGFYWQFVIPQKDRKPSRKQDFPKLIK